MCPEDCSLNNGKVTVKVLSNAQKTVSLSLPLSSLTISLFEYINETWERLSYMC
jgi:hypothetical protein